MPTATGAALATLPQQILNTGMGLLLEGHNDRRARKQARKMQAIQIEGQKEMGRFNYQQQMALWHDTNYGAQMEELKKAGLNPALIYEGAGQGGTTAAQPGSVPPSQVPQGGMEIMNMMMTRAQMELIKAQTEKTKAETGIVPKTGEQIEATTENLKQQTENAKVQNEILQAESVMTNVREHIATETQNDAIAIIRTNLRTFTAQMHKAEIEQRVSAETADNNIKIIAIQYAKLLLENKQIQTAINKTDAEIEAIKQQITIQSLDEQMAKNGINPKAGTMIKTGYNIFTLIKKLIGL